MFLLKLLKDIFVLDTEASLWAPVPLDKTDHYKNELGKLYLDRVLVASPYNVTLAAVIEKFKYHSYPEYVDRLIPFYLSLIDHDAIQIKEYTLIPMPMHWSRYWLRGYDHMYMLVKQLSWVIGARSNQYLHRKRYTKRQSLLDREKRLENVENSFSIRWRPDGIQGKKFILLDDIISTGATANIAAKILKEYGATEVRGYFIASWK